jgi:flagellar biosynthesis protein FlhA
MTLLKKSLHFISHLPQRVDLAVLLFVVLAMAVFILPFPAWAIDLLIVANFAISLFMLVRGASVHMPHKATAYPNHIVLFTLFSLAVSVAITRRILLYGGEQGIDAAGRMVRLFGPSLFRGGYVIGLTVILLLLAVYFIVVNHGAGRIAEVLARFTLNAAPSEQMEIDADLNTGRIDEQGAEKGRKELQREGEFFGAIDGTVKFIQRDAIALFLILLVNMVAGILIGVMRFEMPMQTAMEIFTLLTIGFGLAVVTPAIVASIGAVALVKRLANPTYRSIAEMEMLMLEYEECVNKARADKATNGDMTDDFYQDLSLEIGLGLVPQMDAPQEYSTVVERINTMRQQVAQEVGVPVPPINIKDNPKLPDNSYRLLMRGKEVGRGEFMVGQFWAIDPGTAAERLQGKATKEPAFGMPAYLVSEALKEKAQQSGYMVVDSPIVMTTHISEMLKALQREHMPKKQSWWLRFTTPTYRKTLEMEEKMLEYEEYIKKKKAEVDESLEDEKPR